jgi:hypothetical protein
MADEAGAGGAAAGTEQKGEQYVPWSRFNGVLNENKGLKDNVEDMRGQIQTLTDQVSGLTSGGGRQESQPTGIYDDPDKFVTDRVKAGVDAVMAARDSESREEQIKSRETAAIELLQGTDEWKADPRAADKGFSAVLRELRTDPELFAEVAVEVFRARLDEAKGEGVKEDSAGTRRVKKEVVTSMKGKSSGNGGFTRSQIAGMSVEDFQRNRAAIEKAASEGNISDD